jgi:hypothetical protein
MSVDFSKDRPDFCLPALGVNIEATIASIASGTFPEDARFEAALPDDLNRFNFLSIIRLSNSLISKYRKYIESYSQLDHVLGRPFVIAIANFDQPNSFLACQRLIDQTTGDVAVTWYDARNSVNNNTLQIFGAVTDDGGLSFGSNFQISAGTINAW